MKIARMLAVFFCLSSAAVAEPPQINDIYLAKEDGFPFSHSLEIIKGRTVTLSAKALDKKGAELPVKTFLWSAALKEIVEVKDEGAGRARIKALRDWFDENPRREPTAQAMVCADDFCKYFLVTCLFDSSGIWKARMIFDFIPHQEDRLLIFEQNGRIIFFDAEPGERAVLKLEGASVKLVNGGEVLRVFEGTASDRRNAKGRFMSKRKLVGVDWTFSGTWIAIKRSP